jgi:endogenous inhibitor of DNA gyrase (YacG/DUF329 family)
MTAPCPICHKPTDSEKNADFPFCSERCRLLDLGNWASEKYRVSSPIFDESEFGVPSAPISRTGEAEGADRDSGSDEQHSQKGRVQ